jgi:hypothetical protein
VPITPDHAGRTYAPTTPYEVTRGKVAEFAAALGVPLVDGSGPVVAPPTFGAVVTGPAWDVLFTDPELALQLSRVVHADQQFRYHRPLEPGDVVTATLSIARVRVRGTTEIITTSVDVRDAVEQTVLVADATFVHSREEAA